VAIDKSTIAYAIAAIAIIGMIFFILANRFGAQGLKRVESTEDADEAKLDAAVGKGVDPSPLSQPQKD
jgi:hypothetical protein